MKFKTCINTFSFSLIFSLVVFQNTTLIQAQNIQSKQEQLDSLISEIDMNLFDSSVADIKAWLDAQIRRYGDYGFFDFGFQLDGKTYTESIFVCDSFALDPYSYDCLKETEVTVNDTILRVRLNRGGYADVAAQFFRAFEMFGDSTYLNAGLKTADLFIQLQQPGGHFPSASYVVRHGNAYPQPGKHRAHVARLEDGYQYRPFSLLLYAYRLTGDQKYFDAAKKNADMLVNLQDSIWGWSPTYALPYEPQPNPATSDRLGVIGGGSWADCATTDGFRASVMMYHLTGDSSYLYKSAQIINWVYKTQFGNNDVRGWADNYNEVNFPIPARHHEGYLIDPRNYNRYAGTMLIWFYAATGNEAYRQLFEEAYRWMSSVQRPSDAFAPKYSYDGEEAVTNGGKAYRFSDFPERTSYVKRASSIESMALMYDIMQKEGHEGVVNWFTGPTAVDSASFLDLQIEAARRSSDENLLLRLQNHQNLPGRQENNMDGPYLEQVRLRLAKPNSENLPNRDYMDEGRDDLARQSWLPIHKWLEPWRPPFGWSSWQYVWDVKLALGQIDTAYINTGGRGLEVKYFWPSWDVMGNWEGRAITVPNLLDVPLAQFTKTMTPEELKPNKPDLDTIFEQPTSSVFPAANSTISLFLYPNPVGNTVVMITELSGSGMVRLYALSGTLIKEWKVDFDTPEVRLSLDEVPQGAYILSVRNKDYSMNRKIIKEN